MKHNRTPSQSGQRQRRREGANAIPTVQSTYHGALLVLGIHLSAAEYLTEQLGFVNPIFTREAQQGKMCLKFEVGCI